VFCKITFCLSFVFALVSVGGMNQNHRFSHGAKKVTTPSIPGNPIFIFDLIKINLGFLIIIKTLKDFCF